MRLVGSKLSSVEEEMPKLEGEEDQPKTEPKVETVVKAERRSRTSSSDMTVKVDPSGANLDAPWIPAARPRPTILEGPSGEDARRVLDNIMAARRSQPRQGNQDEMEHMLGNMSIGRKEGFDPREGDDDVFEPTFLEQNPSAPIMDVEEEEAVSPPAGTPAQQYMSFQSVMSAAQSEVNQAKDDVAKQAQEAISTIARSSREVEGRSLRCLEREISIQRREAALVEREEELRERERALRINNQRDPRLNFGNPKGRHRAAKNPRMLFPPPACYDEPRYEPPRRPGLVRFVNKKGREYFRYAYVDDAVGAEPAGANANYIKEMRPVRYNGPPRFGRNTRWFREALNKETAERWTGVKSLYKHEGDQNKDSDSEEERNPRDPRKRTRRGGRGGVRAKRFKDGGACNPEHHGVKRRRGDDDDGEGPPEAREARPRCHSNVFIRQNVNVQ